MNNNMQENFFHKALLKSLVLVAAISAVFVVLPGVGTAQAALSFNTMQYDQELILIKNATKADPDWAVSTSADAGDILKFSVYYHCVTSAAYPSAEQAANMRVRLEAPTDRQSALITTGKLLADNVPEANLPTTANISTPQRMTFGNTAVWYHNGISANIGVTGTGLGSAEVFLGNIPCDTDGYFDNAGFVAFTGYLNNIPVANAGPNKDVFEGLTTILEGSSYDADPADTLIYTWSCSGGSLSDAHALQPVFSAPAVNVDTTYTCALTVADQTGASASDSMDVVVRNYSMTVSLAATPTAGTAPLNGVDFASRISGTGSDPINYIFYCNRSDSGTNITPGWARRVDGSTQNPITATDVCDYANEGVYTAKVIAEQGLLAAENRVTITVEKELRFNAMAGDQEGLVMKNQTKGTAQWTDPISADPNDVIKLEAYYHCGVDSLTTPSQRGRNTRIRITALTSLQSAISANSRVWADNVIEANDPGVINVSNPQRLVFDNSAKWHHGTAVTDIPVETGGGIYAEANIGEVICDVRDSFANAGFVIFTARVSDVYANRPPVISAGPDKEILETQSAVLQGSATDPDAGDTLTYIWNCTGGTLSDTHALQPTVTVPSVTADTQYTCTLTVSDSKGAVVSDSTLITVRKQTLAVNLTVAPDSGTAPLTGVDFTVNVSGTAIGTINYVLYCNRGDAGINITSGWAKRESGVTTNPYIGTDVCDYSANGTYIAKVIVERGTISVEARKTIIVSPNGQKRIDLRINGTGGPVTVLPGTSVLLSWISNGVTVCTASGGWTGSKAISGSETVGPLSAGQTYTLTCIGSPAVAASVTANVDASIGNHAPVASAGPDKQVASGQTVALQGSGSDPDTGDTISYNWLCTGGILSDIHVAQPVFTAPAVTSDTPFTCTLIVSDDKGSSASDSMIVNITGQNMTVSLTVNPTSGSAPLNGVDFTATVTGSATGTINYIFYCNRADSGTNITSGWVRRENNSSATTMNVADACSYATSGTYIAKVVVERGVLAAEARATIIVTGSLIPPTVDLKANGFDGPITIPVNQSAALSWNTANATSCSASGSWTGTKSISGTESTGNLSSSRTYTLTCTGTGGSNVDSVTINVDSATGNHPPVANAGPDKDVTAGQTVILQGSGSDPDNDPITYYWTCNGGTLSSNSVSQPTFTAPSITSDTSYSCTLIVGDDKGASSSDSMLVTVRGQSTSFSVSLSANPNYGSSPLVVDLTADVFGSSGATSYIFYCNRADSGTDVYTGWAYRTDNTYTDPLTIYDVCTYSIPGTYIAKVIAQRGSVASEARTTITVTGASQPTTVDIRANGIGGTITIPNGASATISWTSSNVTSCSVSGAWTGTRATSGSESTGSITSSRTYTITCTGPGGSATGSVTVNIESSAIMSVIEQVRNVTTNTVFGKTVNAKPAEKLEFSVRITGSSNSVVSGLNLRITMPEKLIYDGNVKIDGNATGGNVITGITLANLNPGQSTTVTFEASAAAENQFTYGVSSWIVPVTVYNTVGAMTDSATVYVNRQAVAGAATGVTTGVASQLFDYLVIPAAIAIILVWLSRSYLLAVDEWLTKKKQILFRYKTEKDLNNVISRIRIKEHFKG